MGTAPHRLPRRAAALSVTLTAVLALTCSAALAGAPAPGSSAQVKALVAASHKIKVLPKHLTPTLANAANDNPETVYPNVKYGCPSLSACDFGDAAGSQTLVLFGDSHAEMWLSAMIPWADAHQVKLELLTTLGCPAASVSVWLSASQGYYTACDTNRTKELNLIVGQHPAYVVIAERTAHVKRSPTAYFTNAQWQAGMATTLSTLQKSGARLVVVGDNTLMDVSSPQCLAAYPTSVQRCANPSPNPRAVDQSHQAAERAAATADGAGFINPVPWLCTKTCSPVIGTMVTYWDSYHLSNTYTAYLSKVMGAALTAALT